MSLVTLSMILKNEAERVGPTLASVKPFIDRWAVVDTGSTDGTRDVVRRALDGVPGALTEAPFVDFATTRNLALERWGETSELILWMDAEDILHEGAALRAFLAKQRSNAAPDREAFLMRVMLVDNPEACLVEQRPVDPDVCFDSPRVLRSRAGWRFHGVVHEQPQRPNRAAPVHRVPEAFIRHERRGESAARTRDRWERDIRVLEAALARTPSDTRSAFYLGLTHMWLEHYEDAIAPLQRRIALQGWLEEVYYTKLQLALAYHKLGRPWREVLESYLDAHATSPHRAEALYYIAHHYSLAKEHALCMLFAQPAFALPVPPNERLFVDEDIYRWKAADLVAGSAFYVGQLDLGEAAARQTLKHQPSDARVQKNLEFYLERRGAKG